MRRCYARCQGYTQSPKRSSPAKPIAGIRAREETSILRRHFDLACRGEVTFFDEAFDSFGFALNYGTLAPASRVGSSIEYNAAAMRRAMIVYEVVRQTVAHQSAAKAVEGCLASLTNRGFEGWTHDIGSHFVQTGRLASAFNKRSTTMPSRVAFVSLADRNDVDPALPAVERVPRRRHATIGLPGRDGSGRANIASP